MLAPFDRILVPVDLTERSRAAVEYAAALAEEFGAELDVLFVWQLSDYITGGWNVGTDVSALDAYARNGAAERLDSFLESMDLTGLRVRARLACGDVIDTIVELAEQERYDLIVVGNPERHRLWKRIAGSVPERVSRKAPCPVLTVRPPAGDA